MFPNDLHKPFHGVRFLRASGGVSIEGGTVQLPVTFSPRKRRCFLDVEIDAAHDAVFSAQAEVFLRSPASLSLATSFLRASGGVSQKSGVAIFGDKFSPRKRRCFHDRIERCVAGKVFSAQAEVFLLARPQDSGGRGFLRASGGVSRNSSAFSGPSPFSPRKRRCFYESIKRENERLVFSAQAEVFPLA